MIELRKPLSTAVCLLLTSPFVLAGAPQIHWPSGWQVEEVAPDQQTPVTPATVSRQRAIKNDENGTTLMVMELTGTPIEAGHKVNLQGVLLEMRRSIQKDFARGGYQSVCTKMRATTLSRLDALETTCVITENGRHVLSQTLVGLLMPIKRMFFHTRAKPMPTKPARMKSARCVVACNFDSAALLDFEQSEMLFKFGSEALNKKPRLGGALC
jgi:hypothetical protein